MSAKPLDAGLLRHRVTLDRQTTTLNEYGEQETVWTEYGQRWAQVVDLSGNQLLLAQQIQSEVRTRIVVRYDANIVETMRVRWRTFVFDIKSVQLDPDSGLEFQTLMCSRGLNTVG